MLNEDIAENNKCKMETTKETTIQNFLLHVNIRNYSTKKQTEILPVGVLWWDSRERYKKNRTQFRGFRDWK